MDARPVQLVVSPEEFLELQMVDDEELLVLVSWITGQSLSTVRQWAVPNMPPIEVIVDWNRE